MITYVVGDLFTSPAKVLVNTVNTVGVMGKGIALDFKRVYPEMFQEYQYYCENGMFDVGKLWLYKTSHKWILNFPTKKHWRNRSKLEYIEEGLKKFVDTYDSKGIVSVSFPMLGCGNGELDWKKHVQPLMEQYLRRLPIDIYVHLYLPDARFVPEHRNIHEMRKWLLSEPRSLPFVEFWEDIRKLVYTKGDFETLDNEAQFSVSLDGFAQNLRFEQNSGAFDINRESFEQFWAFLRSKGYFLVRDFPEEMIKHVYTLASFLQNLSYIRPILLSNESDLSDRDMGLFLSLPPSNRLSEPLIVQSA